MDRLMCRPLPLSSARGLGMKDAHSPYWAAMARTLVLKIMALSAAVKAPA